MYLKSLTVKGFKSFPDRTKLVFSPGVSVVVGPNGSGKSNITDAVLWALGEQSPLAVRGQQMQDVIFSGGKGQGPRRYAEVEVVIDNSEGRANTEFSEISIKRRFERGGDGEYRLNGARCRLVDVVDVLSDTNLGREMHSVISQGRVEEIVGSKPRDRRLLVEEAAGLGKHRKRRRRAELKLDKTRENLERALDVEREARSRLRPLKQQAQAAEVHARLAREEMELRAELVADELRGQGDRLAAAEGVATKARVAREAVEARLAEVAERREAAEQRLAARVRERGGIGRGLVELRSARDRLALRLEALALARAELQAGIAQRRQLSLQPAGPARLGDELESIAEGFARIAAALDGRSFDDPAAAELETFAREATELARTATERLREASARLGEPQAPSTEALNRARLEAEEALLPELDLLRAAMEDLAAALGERLEALERRTDSEESSGEEMADELRACSRQEAEIQAELRAAAEAVTQAEVEAAQLRERRDTATAELAEIATGLGRELAPAAQALSDERREEIEVKLERLARRRAKLGPVNPLAEREYEVERERVETLQAERQDVEQALSELRKLISETDRRIHEAFEETFEATARNFEELVEHLFPGGRGRLRRMNLREVRAVEVVSDDDEGEGEGEEDERGGGDEDEFGVEIEVTPAGKSMKRLSLLSGGEKSLVALAFVFAVFLARPCPFYILDEVEAALDDANIDRFLQLVRRFSDRAQFIIVTHQKRTMDAADILYGVSMGQDGVTKVVSKRLPPAQQRELAAEVGVEITEAVIEPEAETAEAA